MRSLYVSYRACLSLWFAILDTDISRGLHRSVVPPSAAVPVILHDNVIVLSQRLTFRDHVNILFDSIIASTSESILSIFHNSRCLL